MLEVFQMVHSGLLQVGIMAHAAPTPRPVDCEVTHKGSLQSVVTLRSYPIDHMSLCMMQSLVCVMQHYHCWKCCIK